MSHRVCPWWLGFFLGNPLRRLWQDPDAILSDLVKPGQTVADIGCGPGFFTIPVARQVGPTGRVIAIDLQPQMLNMVARKARRHGLTDRIVLHNCTADSLGWSQPVDFALAFAIVHETPDPARFLREVASLLRPGARFLFAEPRGHVAADEFAANLDLATNAGLKEIARPTIRASHAVLFGKP